MAGMLPTFLMKIFITAKLKVLNSMYRIPGASDELF